MSSAAESLFVLIQRYRTRMMRAADTRHVSINAMHVQCLRVIAKTERCTANTIVTELERDKSQISSLIKDMVRKGWVSKSPNEADKRSQILVLTPAGRELFERLIKEELKINESMLAGISGDDLETFNRIIRVMLDNLDRDGRSQ